MIWFFIMGIIAGIGCTVMFIRGWARRNMRSVSTEELLRAIQEDKEENVRD